MEKGEFTFDILTDEASSVDISPFDQDTKEEDPLNTQTKSKEEKEIADGTTATEDKDKNTITEINPNALFNDKVEDKSDGVGDEDDTKDEGPTSEKKGSSPSVYSSIATALKEDGVLDLEEDDLKKIVEPEDFAEAIQKQVDKRLDETQQRIKKALDYGVEPEDVKVYEQTINYLNTLTDENIEDESEDGENLRKQLIYQDFINRGFTEDRAAREVEKSIKSGDDVNDAKEALHSNLDFFTNSYKNTVAEAKKTTEKIQEESKKQTATLKKSILETEQPFEGVTIDKNQRIKIFETLTKPVVTTEDGRMLTAIQKFERENPIEFKQKLATLFVLTEGFKKLDNVVKGKLRQETKKNLRELEHVIKNTPAYSGGRINLANSYDDAESHKGLMLDI